MTTSDYHLDYSHVSASALKVFARSRLEYYLTYVAREIPSKPLGSQRVMIGAICHQILLEQRQLADLAVIYPDECYRSDGALNASRAAQFREQHPGKHAIRAGMAEDIAAVCAAVDVSPLGQAIRDAHSCEARYDAHIEGVDCKCKPDIVCQMDDCLLLYDLKFAEDVSPEQFGRTARHLQYWLQDAHYSAVIADALDLAVPVLFRFWAIETQYPHRIMPYWYDPRSREIARDAQKHLLISLARCSQTGNWSDDWRSELQLSPWDISARETAEELIGFPDDDA